MDTSKRTYNTMSEQDPGFVPSLGRMKSAVPTRRKKKHTYGIYPCDHPDCNKVFQRSDHLARHRLTHDSSSKIFECAWAGCGKKFNRSDTMKLHYSRHTKNATSPLPQQDTEKSQGESEVANTSHSTPSNHSNSGAFNGEHPTDDSTSRAINVSAGVAPADNVNNSIAAKISNLLSTNFQMNDLVSTEGSLNNNSQFPSMMPTPAPQEIVPSSTTSQHSAEAPPIKQELGTQTSDILNLFFQDQIAAPNGEFNSPMFNDFFEPSVGDINFGSTSNIEQHSYNLFDLSQKAILHKLTNFPMSPSNLTTSSASQCHINQEIMEKMIALIPSLAINPDFQPAALHRALQIFWSLYNCRIAIVHKPSFDTREAPTILLLAMVMVGFALSRCTDQVETVFVNPQATAEEIAIPLRWAIFQSPELTSAKPWVLQSMIILETFEKHLSTRDLFQRSTIHHATKVQVLRRSTTLGGDPYRRDNFEAETLLVSSNSSSQLWYKWIEAESMKRCAYATFLVDSYNAVLTNQTVALYAHQLKLSLQCDEELWVTASFDQELFRCYQKRTKSFLSTFIDMINERCTIEDGPASPVLLSGIITLIFLFQNTSSMNIQSHGANEEWRDMLRYCLESWFMHIRKQSCTCTDTIESLDQNQDCNATSIYWSKNDHRCKTPIYHLAYVLLRLSNYDWMTFSGSPLLMNVRADFTDYEAVSMRISRWSRSKEGGVGVVNAYIALIECLLPSDKDDPATFKAYRPERDILFERPYCLGQLAIIVWCYNFSLKGPESGFLDNEMNYTFYLNDASSINSHVKEDGYGYLNRIQKLFAREDARLDQLAMSEPPLESAPAQTRAYRRRLEAYGRAIAETPDSHHTAGLMAVLSEMYSKCVENEMCLELSRLMKHCQSRSLGNKEIKCMNMYNDTK